MKTRLINVNAILSTGGEVMRNLFVAMVALALVSVFSACSGDNGTADDGDNCAEAQVSVDGECKTKCTTNEDCFEAGHGGGWLCQVVEGVGGYCAYDPDGSGVTDPSTPTCSATAEVCDYKDNDCDGEIDEGVKNACGQCGEVPAEVCDTVDNDCDGETDEGVLNNCGGCGDVPEEACNGLDDDCDGQIPDVEADQDNDGYRVCDGDCNDLTPAYHPGAEELCDGLDNDCDGLVPADEADEDGDGWRICDNDCNDTDAGVNPAMPEICNAIDDDCNGEVNEGFFVGAPCEGVGACGTGMLECYSDTATICSTMPGGSDEQSIFELCSDNLDNDCDGSVDEGCSCDEADWQICGSSVEGVCQLGWQECQAGGTWGVCEGSVEPIPEECNGLDDDCDTEVPETEIDQDGDGMAECAGDCDEANATTYLNAPELCNGVDDDCDGDVDEDFFVNVPCVGLGACSAGTYQCDGEGTYLCSTMPNGADDMSLDEVCSDLIDNDCDGSVDEGCECDSEEDDVVKKCGMTDEGVCQIGEQTCGDDSLWGECVDSVNPGPELCNGLDDDCDGAVPDDEADADEDEFRICDGDTDDTNAAVNPAADEVCNGIDDNCDGSVDEGFFVGAPCNGVGACGMGQLECLDENSTVCSTDVGGSLDESLAEVCGDNTDNDCDGLVDQDCACDPGDIQVCGSSSVGICMTGWQTCLDDGTWGDCVGNVEPLPEEMCNGLDDNCDDEIPLDESDADEDGVRICEGDCNDADPMINPNVGESCNGLDDNCDGSVDEGFFVGAPCNGMGGCGAGTLECNADGSGTVCSSDPEGSENASVAEDCGDNVDNDCDGSVDEGCSCDPGDEEQCGSSDVGLCKFGMRDCLPDGTWDDCIGNVEPGIDVCDGADNDCDGETDEDYINLGELCSAGQGECETEGTFVCSEGLEVCSAVPSDPVNEVCDDLDNDCDGLVDENFPLGVGCLALGECGSGTYECTADLAGVICSSAPGGSEDASIPEVCGDNMDNDCNGQVDTLDDVCACDPGMTKQCGTSDEGVCQFGVQTCQADGTWGDCIDAIEPGDEVCDGFDNNCNGEVDEGLLNACGQCGDVPAEVCDGEDNNCDGEVDEDLLNACGECGPLPEEVCDGADNDCDGEVDEDFVNLGMPCSDGVGECEVAGTFVCSVDGQEVCSAEALEPTDELCDNLDNNCDGMIDENFPIGIDCLALGECGLGTYECTADGVDVICSSAPGGSEDASAPEVCGDNLDNDCNGQVDTLDDVCTCDPGMTKQCGSSDEGVCQFGVQTCQAEGTWGDCVGAVEPGDEVCDGSDNNCDGEVDEGLLNACGQCGDVPAEVCDGEDNDCDGEVDEDYLNLGEVCSVGQGECETEGTFVCSEGLAVCNVVPGDSMDELCDGLDNDCDGLIDENFPLGVGCLALGECGAGTYECTADEASVICSSAPGGSEDASAPEVCGDNLDNDCNGQVDTLDDVCACDPDMTKQCGTSDEGVCQFGVQTCQADGTWNDCQGAVAPSDEVCDGVDNNCDGEVDEDLLNACGQCGDVPAEVCDGEDNDCDGEVDEGLLNDCGQCGDAPAEVCDGEDNDCDGLIDESFPVGFECLAAGECGSGVLECNQDGTGVICSVAVGGSEDASVPEVCGDNLDNDCDGMVDTLDDECDCEPGATMSCGTTDVGVCQYGESFCENDGSWSDCVGNVEPATEEACNGLDDDCDGAVDQDEVDSDADGEMVCEGDCSDGDPAVNSGADELCNGQDDNCDGAVDEGYYVGVPCLGYGACGAGVYECANDFGYQCSTMPGGSEDQSSPEDCNDLVDNDCDSSVNEGCECTPDDTEQCGTTDEGECDYGEQTCSAQGLWGDCVGNVEPKPEECNGLDDNCNGAVPLDEADDDGDGERVCAGDCNDDAASINTSADEVCNGLDDDCDGSVDEGFFIGAPCVGTGTCGLGSWECADEALTICSTNPDGSADQSVAEVCGDNLDNDCDGSADEDCDCDPDDLAICGTTEDGVCQQGLQTCENDGTWGACVGNVEPIEELCNGLDDDCDTEVPANEADADADGFMLCDDDCDDGDADVYPGADEVCNGVDDDCDGDIDEDCPTIYCNICCGYGLGHPVVWSGGIPVDTWSAEGYCGVWSGTIQQICLRGEYPVQGYEEDGWIDWNCQNGNEWGGWETDGVLWCVDQDGTPVTFEAVEGQVDPEDPDPEGEVILLDNICPQ
ncbi:hypothetical protein HOM83_01505 [Candidatus Falkowbacteria bacterium]|nr:hypothetical protein [Candidatus Falkowbacteria bacterium]